MYCCLPVYHTAGEGLGVGLMMVAGATLVISKLLSVCGFSCEVSESESRAGVADDQICSI